MMERFKVMGIQLNNHWEVNGNSGDRHLLHVCRHEEMPQTKNDIGHKVEVLKVPLTVEIPQGLMPLDDILVDFNRYGRPALIQKVNKDGK